MTQFLSDDPYFLLNHGTSLSVLERGGVEEGRRRHVGEDDADEEESEEDNQFSLLALLVTVFRKSIVGGCATEREGNDLMEIGCPTDVAHVAHVTFDRFHGFLGLPVEFEPDVPRRAPSASANVFGVSTDSMQCSFDCRRNSVPTILLLMQRHLYAQGGIQAEGIFRINAENDQEQHVRDELNRGIVPDDIDVHCLAGLIKAWFRELPVGVLDSLTSDQVMQCQGEEDYIALVKLLPPTEAALLDWAINLMTDVVQEEHHNKMNSHNIAMVFAPNMTQMDDPLTALMYAVQVMNFLKTLIEFTVRERKKAVVETTSVARSDNSDENGHHGPSGVGLVVHQEEKEEEEESEKPVHPQNHHPCPLPLDTICSTENAASNLNVKRRNKRCQSNNLKHNKVMAKKVNWHVPAGDKTKESIMSRINSRVELVESWR